MKAPITILQLSDLHLFGDTEQNFLGINPYQHLIKVVERLFAEKKKIYPNMVILTGDISHDYSLESYLVAKGCLTQLGVPIYATMGNHDHEDIFSRTFGEANQMINVGSNWDLFLFNTKLEGKVVGKLSQESLDLIKTYRGTAKYHMFFTHHHFLPVGCNWLDNNAILNSEEFLLTLTGLEHLSLKGIFSGHIHQESCFCRAGIPFFTVPAVSWQFSPLTDAFSLDKNMPGYRWINLYDDGLYSTICERLDYGN